MLFDHNIWSNDLGRYTGGFHAVKGRGGPIRNVSALGSEGLDSKAIPLRRSAVYVDLLHARKSYVDCPRCGAEVCRGIDSSRASSPSHRPNAVEPGYL
ncbi:hypothetical protein AVEN_249980-1 [Araneus ventricosus]|uniref:Uncharacterized protein n=1 Tax=Araneus ventricosus TaxID=182803 RepID=A0A4Y2HJX4_ARAVE|nr:hypothetical protein AVEN_249980-1 [Araneus ventricosus]